MEHFIEPMMPLVIRDEIKSMGLWLRDGLDHGQHLTGHPQLQDLCCNQRGQAGEASVVWYPWQSIGMGNPGKLTTTPFPKPAKASPMSWPWWKQPLDGWRLPCASHYCPEHKLGPGKASPVEIWHPWESSWTTGLISRITFQTPGPENMAWSGFIISPIMHQLLGKLNGAIVNLRPTLKALGEGTFKNGEVNLAKATWMVNTRGSINQAGPAQSKPLHTVDGNKVPVEHMKDILGKTVWISPTWGKAKPIHGIVFAQGPGYTWWAMQKDGEAHCVPQGGLIWSENCV